MSYFNRMLQNEGIGTIHNGIERMANLVTSEGNMKRVPVNEIYNMFQKALLANGFRLSRNAHVIKVNQSEPYSDSVKKETSISLHGKVLPYHIYWYENQKNDFFSIVTGQSGICISSISYLCGAVLLSGMGSIIMYKDSFKVPECFIISLKEIYNAGFSRAYYWTADGQKVLEEYLKIMGFKQVDEFKNKRSGNMVRQWVVDITPSLYEKGFIKKRKQKAEEAEDENF